MRGSVLRAVALGLSLAMIPIGAEAAAPAWPNYHQDAGHTGNDTAEPPLSAVGGQWTSAVLDANVYAQPIIVGHIVIVATENNTVYGLDDASGNIVWKTHLGAPVPSSALPCGDINPVGITGTPVGDPVTGIVYVVGMVPSPIRYQLWALDLNNAGRGLWTETITPPAAPGQVAFNPLVQGERGALTLANGKVYIPFGGRDGDCGNYRGWIAAAPASAPGSVISYETVAQGAAGAGIWASGGMPVDSSGNIYAATGNTFCGSGCPAYDYSEAVLKLSPTLALSDYFHPSNWQSLNNTDTDIGSISPILLGTSSLAFQAGKEGVGYLLNSSSLGGANHQTQAFSAQVCSATADASFGASAYAAPYLFVPCSNRLEVLNVNTTTPSFASAGHGPNVSRSGPPIVAQGLVWTVDPDNGILYGLNPASPATPVVTVNLPGAADHFTSPAAGDGRIFVADGTVVVGVGPFAMSTNQYRLTGNDGSSWQDIDGSQLSLSVTPTANETAVLGGNADLWTANAGVNQDLGIAVSVNGGPQQLIGWKESGGKAGTFSPNAAYVQTVYAMTAGTTYLFTLQWKTNIPEGSATVFAGAGPLGGGPLANTFSPTTLSLHMLAAGANPHTVVSNQQYQLQNSDGSTWQDIDPTNLALSFTPATSSTAIIGANADLWTANAGVNQDMGIFISGGAFGAGQLIAWKESGGVAGTFSPNAAFLQTLVPLVAATPYTIKVQWKSNVPTGGTIFAAAGNAAPFSPTRLTAELLPTGANPYSAVSTTQYRLSGSNGVGWQDIDAANLKLTITPSSNSLVLLAGNADLWTENATYNQDLGISVSIDGGPDFVIAWKESGGGAGTFSPNAAFVQDVFAIASGHTYVFKLQWKTNKGQPAGYGVRAGAGPAAPFSPTSVSAELISG